MPPNIAVAFGRHQAMYADQPAWHGLGTVVAGARTPEEAQRIAGTDYIVAKAPVYAEVDGRRVELPEHRATYRTDTGDVLGIVGADYPIIQNLTPMQLLGEIVRTHEAGIVAHAALGKGERLFAVLELARLRDLSIPGDPSGFDPFLVAQWWHDATGALAITPSVVRVACQNMADTNLAYGASRGKLVRIAHTGNIDDAVEEARRILGFAERRIEVWAEAMTELASLSIPTPVDRWLGEFVEKLIPIPPDMERPGSREAAREAVVGLFKHSRSLVGLPDSPYRAFQAVTEYADHWRTVRAGTEAIVPEKRFVSIVDGPAADMKARALELLRQEFEVKVPVAR